MTFDETIEASLLPRLLYTLEKRPKHEHEFLISNFRSHVHLLSEFLREEIIGGTLSINTAIGFHVRLYPPGYMIDAMDNHGSPDKPGNPLKISPGAWRQREIRDEPFRSHRWNSVCSPLPLIESDLRKIIEAFNEIQNPRREDILRFCFKFLRVHPFADSNGTTAAVLADALCARHGLLPILKQNIRFKDKVYLWSLCEAFDKVQSEQSLTSLLMKFDAFNRSFPIQELPQIEYLMPNKIKNPIVAYGDSNPRLADRVLEKLLEETRLAIEAGDLPVGCVLTVGDTLLDSNRNTVRSQQGRRFHAERNLLAQLGDIAIPAGRRVVWVTLEPCLRCAQAIQRFGADEVVYVLDDPFGGGKALLAQAGIAVTRREEWERDYLRLMMDSFARYPEFCAARQFRFTLDAWQRHEPLGHDEQVKAVFLHHLASYLPNVTAARQEEVRSAFLAHVNHLTGMTLEECVGVPSVAFVRKLHRALFPPDYRHRAVGNDGVASETASGEWRRHVLWPHYTEFSALEVERDA